MSSVKKTKNTLICRLTCTRLARKGWKCACIFIIECFHLVSSILLTRFSMWCHKYSFVILLYFANFPLTKLIPSINSGKRSFLEKSWYPLFWWETKLFSCLRTCNKILTYPLLSFLRLQYSLKISHTSWWPQYLLMFSH